MAKSQSYPNTTLKEIIAYTLPELYVGKEWYVGFYAFDPVLGRMKRKKIKINFIEGKTKRKQYAEDLKKRLILKLQAGWNPWIEAENRNSYLTFKDVLDKYRDYAAKLLKEDLYREDTYITYMSYLRVLEDWNNKENQVPITYIYQFDKDFCNRFLEDMYIGRDNTATTRDNYLGFLQTFSKWCLQYSYFKNNPTEGISSLGKRSKKKIRTVIADHDMERLLLYLQEKNRYYLLACYILHYCFIRPKELSMLRLSNFSLKRQTVFVPDTVSKNRKDGTITLPAKVIRLMLDLDVFSYPNDYYLFSDNFMPGAIRKDEKQFRDFWGRYLRKDLNFPVKYKFYSLKDTGITNMLRKYDSLTVRDQARHSSILMTDIYTPHDIEVANDLIKNYEGVF
ncbi:MAG: site-specific integrase [Odoribacter splanchnicus]|nr:site-specific integrase [Odoribacter splanchnicus]